MQSSASPGTGHEEELGARKLIDLCEFTYSSYASVSAQVTLDSHVEKTLQQLRVANKDERCSIGQVVYGVFRYRRFISCFLDSFYHYNSGIALRADAVKYRVFVYLAAFRLKELSFQTFRLLLEVQDPQKMMVLLEYLFDADKLQNVCREDWLKVYDKEFVDGTICGLLHWRSDVDELLQQLKEQVYFTQRQQGSNGTSTNGSTSSSPSRRTPTKPQEFNLSQPRPKPLPQPEVIPSVPKPRSPPKIKPGPTKEQLAIEAAKAANRQAIEARKADPRHGPFKLRVLERPMHAEAVRAELEAELAAELAVRPKAKPAPAPPAAEVRLNAAAVLREDALYRKKQLEEAAALQRFEVELRDTAAFDRWQQAMREADAKEQAERIERLRQEMSTAAGAAAQARIELLTSRAAASSAEKAARAAREEERQKLQQQEQQKKAEIAEVVAADRVKALQAKETVSSERRLSAQEVRQRAQEDAQRRAEAAAKGAAERRDIIAQLRGLEKAANAGNKQQAGSGVKAFDPTAVAEYGINEQMSLEELRARLAAAKHRQQEEEERARARILATRRARDESLSSKVEQLAAIRKLASAQATLRKAATQAQRVQTAVAILQQTEADALVVANRIDAKHAAAAAEAARIAAKEKRIKFEQMQTAAGAAVVEANRFRALRDGRAKDTELRQISKLQQAEVEEANAARLAATQHKVLAQNKQQHTALQRQYDRNLAAATQQAEAESARLLTDKQQAAVRRRQEVKQQRQLHATGEYKPFSGGHTTMQARLAALAAGKESA